LEFQYVHLQAFTKQGTEIITTFLRKEFSYFLKSVKGVDSWSLGVLEMDPSAEGWARACWQLVCRLGWKMSPGMQWENAGWYS